MQVVGVRDDNKRDSVSIPTFAVESIGERAHRARAEHPGVLRAEGLCGEHIFLLAASVARCGVCRTDGANTRSRNKSRAKRLNAA